MQFRFPIIAEVNWSHFSPSASGTWTKSVLINLLVLKFLKDRIDICEGNESVFFLVLYGAR